MFYKLVFYSFRRKICFQTKVFKTTTTEIIIALIVALNYDINEVEKREVTFDRKKLTRNAYSNYQEIIRRIVEGEIKGNSYWFP